MTGAHGGKFSVTISLVIALLSLLNRELHHDLTRLSLTLIYTDTLYLTVVQLEQRDYY